MKLRQIILTLLLLLSASQFATAQKVALKSNLGHWAIMGSPNVAVEVALGKKMSIDLYAGANLWKFREPLNVRHWIAHPELRYWFCDVFNGHFVGIHGFGGQFNIGGVDFPVGRFRKLKDYRYQGYAYGAGLSYGYQWILAKHWNIEASIGAGYARLVYEKYPCADCGAKLSEGNYNYWGITRATLSLVYLF